jgi:hypothetical protein
MLAADVAKTILSAGQNDAAQPALIEVWAPLAC